MNDPVTIDETEASSGTACETKEASPLAQELNALRQENARLVQRLSEAESQLDMQRIFSRILEHHHGG